MRNKFGWMWRKRKLCEWWRELKCFSKEASKHRSTLCMYTSFGAFSKNLKILSYELLPMAGKIPGSLIRLPTITSKTRRSVKLFHFITSSFFFPAIRHFPPFLHRYYQLYYFVLFWRLLYTHSEDSAFRVCVLRVLLNFGVKSFSYRIDV